MTAIPDTEAGSPAALPAPAPGTTAVTASRFWPAVGLAVVIAVALATAIDYWVAARINAPEEAAQTNRLASLEKAIEEAEGRNAGSVAKAMTRIAEAETALAAAGKSLATAEAGGQSLRSEFSLLADRVTQLSEAVNRLSTERPNAEVDWSLAEVEYLIFAAAQRLVLAADVTGAERILAAADGRLAELADPALITLRQAIAHDRNDLAAIRLPDTAGLAIYLGDLAGRAGVLPLKSSPIHEHQATAATEPTAPPGAWSSALDDVWRELRTLVVIRETNQVDLAALDPAAQALIRESLRLELVAARLSVLRADTDNLRASIDHALHLLQQHFDPGAEAIANASKALTEMRGLELKPALPTVLTAQATVQSAQAARAAAAAPPAATSPAEAPAP